MNEEQLNAAIQTEYFYLQKTIEDFDSRALTIKAWSVTFSLVAMLAAFSSNSYIPFILSLVSSAVFWLLEVEWKIFQLCYSSRSKLIEMYFRGEAEIKHPLQIGSSWHAEWETVKMQRVKQVMLWPHVALPHGLVMILGGLLFFLATIDVVSL